MESVWDVDVELVESWLLALDQGSYEQVTAALELLAERGPPDPATRSWTFEHLGRGREAGSKARKCGVHNVHTLAVGLGRTGAGLGRTRHVFGTSPCFRGLEPGSSPTSGTCFPRSGAFLPLSVHNPFGGLFS
ncbi:hypothetical protein GCM10027405_03040 [Arthrobacter alkaliphilus]